MLDVVSVAAPTQATCAHGRAWPSDWLDWWFRWATCPDCGRFLCPWEWDDPLLVAYDRWRRLGRMSGPGDRPEPADMASIGRRVAGYRRQRCRTQQGLALRRYCSVEWVHKVERGERRIEAIQVVLADAVRVPAGAKPPAAVAPRRPAAARPTGGAR